MISIRDFIPSLDGIPVSLKSKTKRELVTGVITIEKIYNSLICVGIANEVLSERNFPNHHGKPHTYFIFNSDGDVDSFITKVILQVGNSKIQVRETW